MKVIYVVPQIANYGGKERVLVNKVNYMAAHWDIGISILTWEQRGRKPAYCLSDKVRLIDLDIDYNSKAKGNVILNRFSQAGCVARHKLRVKEILEEERPDIVVSMFGREMSWLYKIKDGSKKVLEYHFNKDALKLAPRQKPLLWLKYWQKMNIIRHYDRFILLTEEDRKDWGHKKNLEVIPNVLTFYPPEAAECSSKKVIAVGRLHFQKGFNRLIDIWSYVSPSHPDWKLMIIGSGEDQEKLLQQIRTLKLEDSVEILPPTDMIMEKYLESSVYVMTSRFEGFPMVLHEAMACGLPVVSYACKCGPRDIINDNIDGFLVEDGDQEVFVKKLSLLMDDEELRKQMGKSAKQNIFRFSEKIIMERWRTLFESLKT